MNNVVIDDAWEEIVHFEWESNPHLLCSWAMCYRLHHLGSRMSSSYIYLPVYIYVWLRGQCRLLQSSSLSCKYFTTYNYIQVSPIHIYIHIQGSFNNHRVQHFTGFRLWHHSDGVQCTREILASIWKMATDKSFFNASIHKSTIQLAIDHTSQAN